MAAGDPGFLSSLEGFEHRALIAANAGRQVLNLEFIALIPFQFQRLKILLQHVEDLLIIDLQTRAAE